MSRWRAYRKARVPKRELVEYMRSGWELADDDYSPLTEMVTILWLKPVPPDNEPPGCVVIGGLWQ